jgi:sugar phosphate isomerase/epimerase
MPVREVKEIKKQLDDLNLKVVNLGLYVGKFALLTDEECEQEIEDFKKYLEIAEVLECPYLRVHPGKISATRAEAEHWERAALWTGKTADLARTAGKKVVLETHHRTLIETAQSCLKMLQMIGRENVGLIYDPSNFFLTPTEYGEETIKMLKDYIFHLHIKDLAQGKEGEPDFFLSGPQRDKPYCYKLLGEGEVDFKSVFKTLEEINYQGWFSAEAHLSSLGEEETARQEFLRIKTLGEGK